MFVLADYIFAQVFFIDCIKLYYIFTRTIFFRKKQNKIIDVSPVCPCGLICRNRVRWGGKLLNRRRFRAARSRQPRSHPPRSSGKISSGVSCSPKWTSFRVCSRHAANLHKPPSLTPTPYRVPVIYICIYIYLYLKLKHTK